MIFRRRRKQTDFAAEIQAHLELEADRLREEGMSEVDARAAAHRVLGNETAVKEQFYSSSRWLWWDHLCQDVRYAFRTLGRSPAFTSAAVLTLALGIGANTAIFSVIDASLLRPLPYPNPDRLVRLYERLNDGNTESLSAADFLDYRRQSHIFEELAAYREWPFNLTGQDRPERVNGAVVTPEFFQVMGVPAQAGRTLTPDRDKPGQARAAVLSHALWESRYGRDPGIVGKTIGVDGQVVTVVGIMPAGFQFPAETEMWVSSRYAVPENPLRPETDPSNVRDSHYFDIIGRLKPGIALAYARAEGNTIADRLKRQYGNDEEATATAVVPLHEDLAGESRPALLILLGAVALLLLIACANVANILLARGATRQKELAIRGALGAGRPRLIMQILTECILLAGAGGALGVILAYWGMKPLRVLVPSSMSAGVALRLDAGVLVFTALVSLASGIVFGILPALNAAGTELSGALKEGGRGSASGLRAQRTRGTLVICEIAMATVLLVCAGLLIRSFNRLLAAPEGFTPERVLTLQLSLPAARYSLPSGRSEFVRRVLERIQAVPGVASAAVTSRLPLNPGNSTRDMDIRGRTRPPSGDITPDYLTISPDYFRAMGIPLRSGRPFTDRDDPSGPGVVIVNEALARHFWPGQDPVGQFVTIGGCGGKGWCQIVGMVKDVPQHHLDTASAAAVYVPYAVDPWPFMVVVARTRMEPAAAASAVEAAIHAVDKDQPVYNVRSMEEVVAKSLSPRRMRMLLLGLFAALALTLACVGIYGVMAYSVAQRSHEIGIRMALGAKPGDVLRLVTVQGLKLAFAGIVAGLLLSLGLARVISNMLYAVRPTDTATLAAVALVLTGVALLASYIPARRATRVDPVSALRAE